MSDYLLPEEILIEILIKLPVKSLIRFTSVCKQWGFLIRSPYFISTHLSNTSQNQAFLQCYDIKERQDHYMVIPKRGPFDIINSEYSELEFPFKSQIGGYFKKVGSCDGLVCLSDLQRIIIFNPAIRSHVVLPRSLIDPHDIHLCALGFGVGSNFYKVVRLVYGRYPQAEIFYLRTWRWRKLTGFDHVRGLVPQYYPGRPIFFDGFVHWISYRSIIDNTLHNSILRFHFGDEVFGEIMLPQELETVTPGKSLGLAVMGESLGAFTLCDDHIDTGRRRCDVWMMKDYGVKESWIKLYTIDCEHFNRVIGSWGSEALVMVGGHELASYNPETKRIRHVMHLHSGNVVLFYENDYKESLVLLEGGYSGDSGKVFNNDLLYEDEFKCVNACDFKFNTKTEKNYWIGKTEKN